MLDLRVTSGLARLLGALLPAMAGTKPVAGTDNKPYWTCSVSRIRHRACVWHAAECVHVPQAAMLDLRVTSGLARLLGALLPAMGSGDPVAGAAATMALEVVFVLANPTVCLNPQQPAAQRAVQEAPSKAEVRPQSPCNIRAGM